MQRFLGLTCLVLIALAPRVEAQRELSGTAEVMQALDRLQVLGTVLMIAAHPDDENTALLAYLARGRDYRAAYLSLTRGEGGQNLIGSEQGDLMGVIRTQELLAARRIDGAEQYFTRAVDFGYSKTAEETFAKWGHEKVLGDIVWMIRKLRPDVIVLRFSGTPRDGHGHHQSSGILGREAFEAAADPTRFPEQLESVEPWQAKRLMWNVFAFRGGALSNRGEMPDRVDIDVGAYDPVLGYSYTEIAGMSRSMHRSQGFGAAEQKGSMIHSLTTVAGELAETDLMDGIDTTWNRVPGGARAGEILARAANAFEPENPAAIVPLLVEARAELLELDHPWARFKLHELDETIALAAGLWFDAAASQPEVTPGMECRVDATVLNRSEIPVTLLSAALDGQAAVDVDKPLADNKPQEFRLLWPVPEDAAYSHPYWLRLPKEGASYQVSDPELLGRPDTPPELNARFVVLIGGQKIEYVRPVTYRWVDRVRGEQTRPIAIVPPVAARLADTTVVFPSREARRIEVELTSNSGNISGEVALHIPDGWRVAPATQPFHLEEEGQQQLLSFEVTPPENPTKVEAEVIVTAGGRKMSADIVTIDYEHIPVQTLARAAESSLVRVDARNLARQVGYIMGAGDNVPEALRQLGAEVTLLDEAALTRGDLSRFDAIVTGVRAYNVRRDLQANKARLLDYVKQGGTLIVQYNVVSRGPNGVDPLDGVGPYPIEIGRGRVSVEEASMEFLTPEHPVLRTPNRIVAADFDGWIQERGLYFAEEWDERYQPLFASHDPGEDPLPGNTLYARYGDGVYIFTGLSFFRELPAGVPGAYRLFANFLSAGADNE